MLGIERRRIRDAAGDINVFTGKTAPVPEKVVILTEEEVRPLQENADRFGLNFLRAHGIQSGSAWTLEDLDLAFTGWLLANDKTRFTDDYVIEVVGAMFGEYCVRHLDMRWIKLTDQAGTVLAVEGVKKHIRGFPHHSVAKRILDKEPVFFQSIFTAMRHDSTQADDRTRAT